MIRTQISMTPAQAEGLRRLAAARRRSQAALLRDALDGLLGDDERRRLVERARRPVGAFASGHRTTSARHDEVLDHAYSPSAS
ncbi:ribbon-helix-helix protein, CopG family [Rhabdothermincola sediminis]|uniref:ribbon-helix-helix protein, CopG family n=1 Tax=Rhabdothermincola sediminis TaxID=2751370 RepID=UPI001AA022C4|nr:ribbon-helix-helix protein, CopG family [Rhabdothermincola sediminis]